MGFRKLGCASRVARSSVKPPGRALALLLSTPWPPTLDSIRVRRFLHACTMHGPPDDAALSGSARFTETLAKKFWKFV